MTRSRDGKTTRRTHLKLGLGAGASWLLGGCGGSDSADDDSSTGTGTGGQSPVAIIIGSGFGGAVAALRLGQAGVRTVVLERGRRWPVTDAGDTFSPTLPPDGRSTWFQDQTVLPIGPPFAVEQYAGVLERIETATINVYTGAAVGGGSVVYGGMTVQPTADLFARVFPAELPFAELDEIYFPRVRSVLATTVVPDDVLSTEHFQFSRVFEAQGAAASLQSVRIEQACDWEVIRSELAGSTPPSALRGEGIYGANSGWKNSLDRNYLPLAEETGNVTIEQLHRVTEVGRDGDGYVLSVERIDEFGVVLETLTMPCDYLFLAAGAMATPGILMKARADGHLPDLADSVGTGWGSNGNAMFMRSGLGVETGASQASPPVSALEHFDNAVSPVFVEGANYPLGIECECLLSLGLGLETERGVFEHDATTGTTQLNWPAGGNDQAVAAVTESVDRLNEAAGGGLEMVQVPGVTDGFTYHPLGGAVMGQVCDLLGRVAGYERLYVIDGSLIPGSTACANPSLTIAAIAERNIERILLEDFA